MTLDPDNVRVGVTGAVYVAPLGTAVPTTPGGALNANFDDVGYISDDGVTESNGADHTDIKAWQNGDVVRKVQTKHDLTFHFTMVETKDTSLQAYYGNYAAGVVHITGDDLPHNAWVLDVIDGSDKIRIVLTDAQITERGDIAYKTDEAVAYEVTLTAFPDSSGIKAYKYLLGAGS